MSTTMINGAGSCVPSTQLRLFVSVLMACLIANCRLSQGGSIQRGSVTFGQNPNVVRRIDPKVNGVISRGIKQPNSTTDINGVGNGHRPELGMVEHTPSPTANIFTTQPATVILNSSLIRRLSKPDFNAWGHRQRCKVSNYTKNVELPGCRLEPIELNLAQCAGECYSSVRPALKENEWTFKPHCRCCMPQKHNMRKITVHCDDGESVREILIPTACKCTKCNKK